MTGVQTCALPIYFSTGTSAAAAGGITLVFEMPNTIPPVDSDARLLEKKELVRPKAHVDFALHGLVRDTSTASGIEKMIKSGAIGFKAFMGPTTGNIPPPSHGTLYEVLDVLSKHGVPLLVHAEDDNLINYFTSKAKGPDPFEHLKSRPYVCEMFSAMELLSLSEYTGAKVHIVHISSRHVLKVLKWAREYGINLSGETCTHYLFLNSDIYKKVGNIARMNPPIREKEDSEALLNAIRDGTILTIGSDHSPHTLEEKLSDNPPSGMPGLETQVPLLLNAVKEGRLDLTDIVRLLSENVAKLFGLYPRYGAVLPGSRGNLTIVSLNSETKINAQKFYSKAKYSPFDGAVLSGKVMYTIVGGDIAYDGEVHDVRGEFVSKIS